MTPLQRLKCVDRDVWDKHEALIKSLKASVTVSWSRGHIERRETNVSKWSLADKLNVMADQAADEMYEYGKVNKVAREATGCTPVVLVHERAVVTGNVSTYMHSVGKEQKMRRYMRDKLDSDVWPESDQIDWDFLSDISPRKAHSAIGIRSCKLT